MSDAVIVTVPRLNDVLEPPSPGRVRALKRHLVQSLRDLRVAKRPERLIQPPTPEPTGFTATVARRRLRDVSGPLLQGRRRARLYR